MRAALPLREIGHKDKLHVELEWKPFTSAMVMETSKAPEVDSVTMMGSGGHGGVAGSDSWSTSVLYCTVKGVQGLLPGVAPYVSLQVAGQKQRTEAGNGCNPLYQQTFRFKLNDPMVQEVHLYVRDASLGKSRTLGSLSFKISDIVKSSGLQGRWHLDNAAQGFSQATMDLSFELRTVSPTRLATLNYFELLAEKAIAALAQATLSGSGLAAATADNDDDNGVDGEKAGTVAKLVANTSKPPTGVGRTLQRAKTVVGAHGSDSLGDAKAGSFKTAVARQAGELFVRIHGCEQLSSLNTNGYSDPVVSVVVDGVKKKTRVIKQNLNPVFDEEFYFAIENPAMAVVTVTVKDHEVLHRNRFIGDAVIPLYSLPPSAVGALSAMPLPWKEKHMLAGVPRGAIWLSLCFVELSPAERKSAKRGISLFKTHRPSRSVANPTGGLQQPSPSVLPSTLHPQSSLPENPWLAGHTPAATPTSLRRRFSTSSSIVEPLSIDDI